MGAEVTAIYTGAAAADPRAAAELTQALAGRREGSAELRQKPGAPPAPRSGCCPRSFHPAGTVPAGGVRRAWSGILAGRRMNTRHGWRKP